MIKGFIWICKIYQWAIIAYAISTWAAILIPFPQGYWLFWSILMFPVTFLFGWARIGSIGLDVFIAYFLLNLLIAWLLKFDPDYQRQQELAQAKAEPSDAERLAREHTPPKDQPW
jgi:hypothetical protein